MKRTWLKTLSAFLILVLTAPAWAAPRGLVTTMRYEEGPGIKISDSLVLHPGLLLEGRYDSNPLAVEQNRSDAGYMRVIGHFDLATRSPQRRMDVRGSVLPQRVEFRLKGAMAYRAYFSDREAVRNQSGLEAIAGLKLKLFPQKLLSFELFDDYERSITPANYIGAPPQGGGVAAAETLLRNDNTLGLRGHVSPGGKRLTFTVGYNFDFRIYENTGLENLNRFIHEVIAYGKWKLYPKTALTLELTQGFVDYYETDLVAPRQPVNVGSMPLRVRVGLTGLLTPRLTTLLQVGYGNGFYDDYSSAVGGNTNRDSYSGPLGRVEFTYQVGPTANVIVGFDHDFHDSQWANYYIDEHPYIKYEHGVMNRFIIHGQLDYRYRQYDGFDSVNDFNDSGSGTASTITEYTTNLVGLIVGVDYRIREWVYVGVAYEFATRVVGKGSDIVDDIYTAGVGNFGRHQVIGKVGASY